MWKPCEEHLWTRDHLNQTARCLKCGVIAPLPKIFGEVPTPYMCPKCAKPTTKKGHLCPSCLLENE